MTKKQFFLDVIDEWKLFWMNQRQNSEQDYQNYYRRAIGVDANMRHDLANRLEKAIEIIDKERKEVNKMGIVSVGVKADGSEYVIMIVGPSGLKNFSMKKEEAEVVRDYLVTYLGEARPLEEGEGE